MQQKYQNDLKKYYDIVKTFEKYKEKIGEENFRIIKKVFHPLHEYRENKKLLEKCELAFCNWILKKENIKKYNITKERQAYFLQKRAKIVTENEAISRLFSSLSRKWSLKQ